jgi:hypothetical protein
MIYQQAFSASSIQPASPTSIMPDAKTIMAETLLDRGAAVTIQFESNCLANLYTFYILRQLALFYGTRTIIAKTEMR